MHTIDVVRACVSQHYIPLLSLRLRLTDLFRTSRFAHQRLSICIFICQAPWRVTVRVRVSLCLAFMVVSRAGVACISPRSRLRAHPRDCSSSAGPGTPWHGLILPLGAAVPFDRSCGACSADGDAVSRARGEHAWRHGLPVPSWSLLLWAAPTQADADRQARRFVGHALCNVPDDAAL